MHLLTIHEPLNIGKLLNLKASEYVVEDHNGAQLMNLAGGGTMRPLTERRPFDDTKDWNGKNILLVRAGGFGDIVLMTPIFRELKLRWPECKVSVACMAVYGAVLQHLPFVDESALDSVELL